jgi:hypothetical protein
VFNRISLLVLVFLLSWFYAPAQEIVVHGRFLDDSVKIGQQIRYALSAHHPASQSIVFPDSTFSFAPFEIQKKSYFPTRTHDHISDDSAVYFLSTFEIDSLQWLALPVFVIHPRDCTAVFSHADTVVLKQMVGTIPESVAGKDLPLKTNADYLNVRWLLNYPLVLLVVGILFILAIVVWIVFGKRIRKYFAIRRLTRNHFAFLDRFNQHIEKLRKESTSSVAESILVIWKKYMESLEARPYTKLTTKEILKLASDERLRLALQRVDRLVYAGDQTFSEEAFDELRLYSQEQFSKKTEEVKHG